MGGYFNQLNHPAGAYRVNLKFLGIAYEMLTCLFSLAFRNHRSHSQWARNLCSSWSLGNTICFPLALCLLQMLFLLYFLFPDPPPFAHQNSVYLSRSSLRFTSCRKLSPLSKAFCSVLPTELHLYVSYDAHNMMIWVVLTQFCAYFIFPFPKCKLSADKDGIIYLLDVYFIDQIFLSPCCMKALCEVMGDVHE